MTEIFFSDISSLELQEYLKFSHLLPKAQQEKLSRLKNRNSTMRSLCAWLLLSKVLEKRGFNTSEITVSYNEHGKPYFKELPDLHFNLSHSEGFVMCAISDAQVGCDIEYVRPIDMRLSSRYFHAEESLFLNSVTDEKEKKDAFFRLWTLKESFIKASGLGFALPLQQFCIEIKKDSAILKKTPPSFGQKVFFKEYSCIEGYKCACCALSSDFAEPQRIILYHDIIL